MLLLVPYHGLIFLQGRGDDMLGLDFSVYWLHLWRMGLFFAVSGFLAAMTLMLWGPSKQVTQRLKRIGIPLVIAMLTVLPTVKLIVFWFQRRNNPGVDLPAFEYTFGNIFTLEPLHLWFLAYLLLFNLVAVVAWLLLRRLPEVTGAAERWFRRLLDSVLLIPVLAVLSSVPLLLGGFGKAPNSVAGSLVPVPAAFAYYGVFFVFGLMLWRCRDRLAAVESKPWLKLAVSVVASLLAYLIWTRQLKLPLVVPVRPTVLMVGGIAAWSTMFAVWGLFARFLSGAKPWVRYLADASYWIYLIHLPVLVLMQLSLARTGLPPTLRLGIATTVAIGVALATYVLLVRYTRVGKLLHGPRTRPVKDPAGVVLSHG